MLYNRFSLSKLFSVVFPFVTVFFYCQCFKKPCKAVQKLVLSQSGLTLLIKSAILKIVLSYTTHFIWSNFRPLPIFTLHEGAILDYPIDGCITRQREQRLPLELKVKIAPNPFTAQQSAKFTPFLGRFYSSKFTVYIFFSHAFAKRLKKDRPRTA